MPAPNINHMNTRLRIEVKTTAPDHGYHTETWSTFATIWAAETSKGVSEQIIQERRRTLLNIDFQTHYRPDILDTMRVVKGTTYFDITSIEPDVEDHLSMVIHCVEAIGG